jgi:hypothetical protein
VSDSAWRIKTKVDVHARLSRPSGTYQESPFGNSRFNSMKRVMALVAL